ncbi:MAG: hypothetical protein JW797_01855 [Bradymonadales bacterium]|nr:hypothetical protein [Bradymonadales bacterium]
MTSIQDRDRRGDAIGLTILMAIFLFGVRPGWAQEAAVESEQPQQEVADFSGRWSTTYGVLELTQQGDSARGTYSYGGGSSIEGRVNGNRLQFRYREPIATGEGWFEMATDGQSFAGQWREDGASSWYAWTGTRFTPPIPTDAATGMSGLFDTTYGRLRLFRSGEEVVGSYSFQGGSSIEGRMEGNRLVFRYTEPTAAGEGWFEMAPDGSMFEGAWRADGTDHWSSWVGERVQPVQGIMWLVVLEAPWELSLAENEYSFGEMLRAYFERYPHVRVRHRRFYDLEDFRRATSALAFLAEPVALLVAGHGQGGQLMSEGERIPPDEIGRALAKAPNVFVVHFSSCEMMTGTAPEEIKAQLPEGRSVAISGYATSVDWSASALLEFFYLDLVLGRGMQPGVAAHAVLRDLAFAGDQTDVYSPLGAAQFRFVE